MDCQVMEHGTSCDGGNCCSGGSEKKQKMRYYILSPTSLIINTNAVSKLSTAGNIWDFVDLWKRGQLGIEFLMGEALVKYDIKMVINELK